MMSHVVKAWLDGGHGRVVVLDLPGRLDAVVRSFLGPAAANVREEGGGWDDKSDEGGEHDEFGKGGGAPDGGLLRYVAGSVTDASTWAHIGALSSAVPSGESGSWAVTHIVHGAAVTPTAAEEASHPLRVLEVSLLNAVTAVRYGSAPAPTRAVG